MHVAKATMVAAVLVLAACGESEGGEKGPLSTASEGRASISPVTTQTTGRSAAAAADLEFRPVLSVVSATGSNCAGSETSSQVPGAGSLRSPSSDGTLCYLLGPVGLSGDRIDTATAAPVGGSWAITVAFDDEGQKLANATFNRCYDAEPATCPASSAEGRGTIAIVLDGRVISAPAVQGRDLADDEITISGFFTEAAARQLAAALSS